MISAHNNFVTQFIPALLCRGMMDNSCYLLKVMRIMIIYRVRGMMVTMRMMDSYGYLLKVMWRHRTGGGNTTHGPTEEESLNDDQFFHENIFKQDYFLEKSFKRVYCMKGFSEKTLSEIHYSLDGRGRGPPAGHAGVGGVRPGSPAGGGQPGQQGHLRGTRGHA